MVLKGTANGLENKLPPSSGRRSHLYTEGGASTFLVTAYQNAWYHNPGNNNLGTKFNSNVYKDLKGSKAKLSLCLTN
jgi:hypothetical protein